MAPTIPLSVSRFRLGAPHGDISEQWRPNRSIPANYFLQFSSTTSHASQDPYVACQFSCDRANEHLLALGDESGCVYVVDVRNADESFSEKLFKKAFMTEKGMVLDMIFVAESDSQLVTISGHSNVTLWDFQRGVALRSFIGHEGSVRALSQSTLSPGVFVSGSRDGTLCVWDVRTKMDTCGPTNCLLYTHAMPSPSAFIAQKKKQSVVAAVELPKGITSLVHIDESTVASSSTSYKTGIRLWDIRYHGKCDPVRVLQVPQSDNKRDFGVACMCVDRFSYSLFAASTGADIFEFALNTSVNTPVRVLAGASRSGANSYEACLSASPNSDHLLFAGGDNHALLWDLQECFPRESMVAKQKYLPYPKFLFEGHNSEVTLARFSCEGRYIVTVDEGQWRAWHWRSPRRFSSPAQGYGFQRASLFPLPKTVVAATDLEHLSLLPTSCSPVKMTSKRRIPMSSPFKSPFKARSIASSDGEIRSPSVKLFKLSTSPLSDVGNIEIPKKRSCSRSLSTLFDENFAKPSTCAFHFKHPTQNLPDSVKERLLNKYSETLKENPKLKCKIEDFFAELGESASNCSRMVPLVAKAMMQQSPRKLVLRKRLRESASIAVKQFTQATPHQPKRARDSEPASAAMETPRSTVRRAGDRRSRGKRISISKTLKDFFSTNS